MKFLCDIMLGKLAKYLRILGLDADCVMSGKEPGRTPASTEPRLFLTRRSALKGGEGVIFIHADRPRDQLLEIREVIRPFVDGARVMTRCLECNVPLLRIAKEDVEQLVPEFVFHKYEIFMTCPLCRKVYWAGSHAAHMGRLLEEVFGESGVG